MKKLFLLIGTTFLLIGQSSATTMKDIVHTIESTNNFTATSFLEGMRNYSMDAELDLQCTDEKKVLARTLASQYISDLTSQRKSLSRESKNQKILEQYNQIANLHRFIDQVADDKACILKTLLYTLGGELYSEYKNTEFSNFVEPEDKSFDQKVLTLDNAIQKYAHYEQKLGLHIIPMIENPQLFDTLTTNQKIILEKTSALYTKIISFVLYILHKDKFLTTNDIKELSNKISFEYVRSCEIFHANISLQNFSVYEDDILVDTEKSLKKVSIKINSCDELSVIMQMPSLIEKLVIHEIGHYIAYLTDQEIEKFFTQCRFNETQKPECKVTDFITDYAKNDREEDYAETLTHRYIKTIKPTTDILKSKFLHFDDFRKKMIKYYNYSN